MVTMTPIDEPRAQNPMSDARVPAPWLAALVAAVLVAVGIVWQFTSPLPQPEAYHRFFDQSTCFGIPHCRDTLSNIPFIIVGLMGAVFVASSRSNVRFIDTRERLPYLGFFIAVALTGVWSGYYHLAPDNPRLAWDRAGIALAFASWFCAVVSDRASPAWGRRLLLPLLAASVASVIYWITSERAGQGDLRAYLMVQLTPYLLVPILLWAYRARYRGGEVTVVVMVLYALALVCDRYDRPIAEALGFVSGHTLKHLVGALAAAVVLIGLARRRPNAL